MAIKRALLLLHIKVHKSPLQANCPRFRMGGYAADADDGSFHLFLWEKAGGAFR